MSDLINKYPYTDFHAVNLDYILKLVRENAGLHLEESGNQILLKTADNTIVSAITAPYAASAGSANTASSASYASSAGSAASATYATSAGSAATATNATNAANATKADFATTAGSATSADSATYASTAASATNATNAVIAQTALYANTTGNVEHALNAFEKVEADGNNLKFTKGDNNTSLILAPFATKAYRDNSNNIISTTYVANVVDNNGTLEFKNALGNTIVSLIPSVTQAVTDSYGNTIADYVKSVSVESGSDYVTIDHGTGTAETLQIPYSDKAWKDTNGNVIKNTYIKRLEIITDPNDGHKKLVAYNGDNPEAELFRIPVEAYRAQEAAEADHAAAADYATNAGTAQRAAAAGTCDTSAYFIDCYDNNDNGYSIDDPNTIGINGFYDNAGNSIPLSDITSDDWHNVYFRLRPSQNVDYYYTYKVDTTYKVGSPTSPVFFKARPINTLEVSNGVDELTITNIEIGILNGAVATSKLFTYTAALTRAT